MYTRNYSKQKRYSPPPGYAGSAFGSEGEVKHHLPSDEVMRTDRDEPPAKQEAHHEDTQAAAELPREKDGNALRELLQNLRGRFGSEELLILAVMLLIAQDGISVEVLILALILIAG